MPEAGFEPTIPVFERFKTISALYLEVNGMGNMDGVLPYVLA
jgi:hypothetical protein